MRRVLMRDPIFLFCFVIVAGLLLMSFGNTVFVMGMWIKPSCSTPMKGDSSESHH